MLILTVPLLVAQAAQGGVHFDWTISLGTIVMACSTILGIWMAAWRTYSVIDKRLALSERGQLDHTRALAEHAQRMEKQDDLLLNIVRSMERLTGRLETAHSSAIGDAAAEAVRVLEKAKRDALDVLAAATRNATVDRARPV